MQPVEVRAHRDSLDTTDTTTACITGTQRDLEYRGAGLFWFHEIVFHSSMSEFGQDTYTVIFRGTTDRKEGRKDGNVLFNDALKTF